MRSRPRFHIIKHSLDCKIGTLLRTYASLIGGGLPPGVSKLVNVAKYRHFDFETGLDTDTHARRPVFGGRERCVKNDRFWDTLTPLPRSSYLLLSLYVCIHRTL